MKGLFTFCGETPFPPYAIGLGHVRVRSSFVMKSDGVECYSSVLLHRHTAEPLNSMFADI